MLKSKHKGHFAIVTVQGGYIRSQAADLYQYLKKNSGKTLIYELYFNLKNCVVLAGTLCKVMQNVQFDTISYKYCALSKTEVTRFRALSVSLYNIHITRANVSYSSNPKRA